MSSETSLEMDDAPVAGESSPVTSISTLKSLWQNDLEAFRVDREISWKMGRSGAVKWISVMTKTEAVDFVKPLKGALKGAFDSRDALIRALEADNAQLKAQLEALRADCKRYDLALTFLGNSAESHKRHLANLEKKLAALHNGSHS